MGFHLEIMTSHELTWHAWAHDITWAHMTSHEGHMTSHELTDITWAHMTSHEFTDVDITWDHMRPHDIRWGDDIIWLTREVRGVNEMIVESPLDEHARDSVSVLRLLRSKRAHHFRHLLPSEVQVYSLSVSGIVDLNLHVLERSEEWGKRKGERAEESEVRKREGGGG